MHGAGDGFFPGAGRTHQQQRLAARRFACNPLAQGADRLAVAQQRSVHPVPRLAQEFFRDAKLALERCGPLGDASLERCVRRSQGFRGPVPLVIELRVANGARDLVGHDRDQRTFVIAEGAPDRGLDREDADELVADQQRHRELALGVGEPGNRNRVAEFRGPVGLEQLASLRGCVGTLLPQVADLQHLALLGDHADHAGADRNAPAERLILEATARHDAQRLLIGLEQQNVGVMEFEQIVHRPQSGLVNLVQVERRVDLRRDALQDLELGGVAHRDSAASAENGFRATEST